MCMFVCMYICLLTNVTVTKHARTKVLFTEKGKKDLGMIVDCGIIYISNICMTILILTTQQDPHVAASSVHYLHFINETNH